MKTIKQISAAIIASVLFLTSNNVGAQSEAPGKPTFNSGSDNSEIGLRVGETSGLTFKHFVNQTSAFEGIVGIWPNAFGLTALYEKRARAFNLEGLNWYYGGGGNVTFENNSVYYYRYNYGDTYFYRYRSEGSMGIGVDGILGLEYKIKAIPFAISLDMKPFMEVNTGGGIYFSLDPGLGIKFVF